MSPFVLDGQPWSFLLRSTRNARNLMSTTYAHVLALSSAALAAAGRFPPRRGTAEPDPHLASVCAVTSSNSVLSRWT